jgi:hypothetical protein
MVWLIRAGFGLLLTSLASLLIGERLEAGRCYVARPSGDVVCDARLESGPAQFERPQPRRYSLLDRTTYAYMEDNINIYPEPNLASTPIRNVGQGYLWVTLHGELEANGHRWVEVNRGEYALAEHFRKAEVPGFRGVKIAVQPERPFGWIVQDVTPSDEPDDEPNPDFGVMERLAFFEVYDARVGQEDWIWYEIGDGRWIRQTYVSLVEVNPPPPEVGPGEFWTEVDLYEQTFAAYEGTRMVYATLISSGLNRWPTREGIFQVFSRYLQYKMSGAEGKIDYYFIEDVPYIMYFDRHNEIALHGAFWHDRYGFKHSHGCVNMPPYDAEWVYFWSAEASNDLWVWVHTSDPHHYFDRLDN